ncbi:ATP-dependent RNA helicase DBP4 [Holothuria leucospilota]|uniref:ATP-dependent RNA helicase DBP4 n=1 Tax=Holothuria leucospilota TaxID=206669 RepID=A0A9Q1BIV2_HOLLE|nr:ATP-dependent RNA helicase DBP4 [Holothuria leucospilota]
MLEFCFETGRQLKMAWVLLSFPQQENLHTRRLKSCSRSESSMNFQPVLSLAGRSHKQKKLLDAAEWILDLGPKSTMNAILEHIPVQQRQTVLFSATETK